MIGSATSVPGGPEADRRPRSRLLRSVLGVRLFYKILLANAAIVAICAAAAAALARSAPGGSWVEVVGLFGLTGVLVSVGVNAMILKIALGPLDRLERTAAAILGGDLRARAPRSPLADRDLERLIRTFNGMLDQQILYRDRLRTIAARALDTAEEERKRIARELHDETAQTLASVLLRLRAARAATEGTERARLLQELRSELVEAIERMRRFAQGLRPPALEMLGLIPALELHARTVGETAGLRIEIAAEAVDGLLSEAAELALFRIVQEALSNVVRHAHASRVRILVRREGALVVALVEDDGRGFDPAEFQGDPDRGLGLFGMEERASYIGGRIEVSSEVGSGARVRVEVPIDEGGIVAHVR